MARPIDADVLKEALLGAIKDAPLYIQATVEQYIDEAPTLTPPNEPLTCEGCYYIKNDDYPPCAWCIRSKENEDYYHCPPESEAALRREQDG